MATPRERGLSVLRAQLDRWGPMSELAGPDLADHHATIAGTVGALQAAGLLAPDEAAVWKARKPGYRAETPVVSADTRQRAPDVLAELLEGVTAEDASELERYRFEGALSALDAIGAADFDSWNDRLARLMGWLTAAEYSELTGGGTEAELLSVLGGPAEAVDGIRILFALRFADGISFFAVREEAPGTTGAAGAADDGPPWNLYDFQLRDEVGTDYVPGGGGGSDREQQISFWTGPPAQASWVELVSPAGRTIRLPL
jgi:hypothetical protein